MVNAAGEIVSEGVGTGTIEDLLRWASEEDSKAIEISEQQIDVSNWKKTPKGLEAKVRVHIPGSGL